MFTEELPTGESHKAFNLLTKKIDETLRLTLIHRVVTKLYGCPERVNEVCDLYGGTNYDRPTATYDPAPENSRLETLLVPSSGIDISKIWSVISLNAFGLRRLRPLPRLTVAGTALPYGGSPEKRASALFTLPSLFNHACHSNAMWLSFGDIMVIRAIRDIPAGVEINIPYTGGFTALQRSTVLKDYLEGRLCGCAACEWDRANGEQAIQRRAELWNKWTESGRPRIANTSFATGEKLIKNVIKRMKATYKQEQSIRLELALLHFEAMQYYQKMGARTGRLDLLFGTFPHGFEGLACAGFVGIDASVNESTTSTGRELPLSQESVASSPALQDQIITNMIFLSRNFAEIFDYVRAQRWFRASWWGKSDMFNILAA